MKTAHLLNGALWVLNVLLGAATVVFAFQYLLFHTVEDPLQGMKWWNPEDMGARPDGRAAKMDITAFRVLPNPLVPRQNGKPDDSAAPPPRGIKLVGTLPGQAVAFLEVTARRTTVAAELDQKVLEGDVEVPELRGWVLSEVHRDRAVFTSGERSMTLRMEDESIEPYLGDKSGPTGPPPPPGSGSGPYNPENYPGSQKIQSGPNHEIWRIEDQEADYAVENMEAILAEDLLLSAYPDGGIKVDSVRDGSIAASRGLMAGDVVKSINGVPVRDVGEVRNLFGSDRIRKQGRLRVVVQRAGRALTFEYRSQSR